MGSPRETGRQTVLPYRQQVVGILLLNLVGRLFDEMFNSQLALVPLRALRHTQHT